MPYRFSYISMIWNVLPRSTLKTVVIAFFIILSISTTQYFFIAKKKKYMSTWNFSEKGHH